MRFRWHQRKPPERDLAGPRPFDPTPPDKLCIWGFVKLVSTPPIPCFHELSCMIIPLEIAIDIPHFQTCPDIPSLTLLGGGIRMGPISLEQCQVSHSVTDFSLHLRYQNICVTWTEAQSWDKIQGSRCQMGSIQPPTTVATIQVQWFWTGCGSCWNPCFKTRNPQSFRLHTHIQYIH